MLSIVIPTEFDPDDKFLNHWKGIESNKDLEIIFISKKEAYSRAERLNIGFKRSKGLFVLFHHPRSQIEIEGINYLISLSKSSNPNIIWGGFIHKFDTKHFLLQYTSWYSNKIRAKLKGILYLDHCIFFHRDLWQLDLPNIEIFEDTILSKLFLKSSKPILLPFISLTSSIRFEKNGVLNQLILNQLMKIAYYLNINPTKMNNLYEKNIQLNRPS